MRKQILFVAALMFVMFLSAETLTMGNGTTYSRYPLGYYLGYERSASLYSSTELGANNKEINTLAWYTQLQTSIAVPTKIYLKTTTASYVEAMLWSMAIDQATLVFDAVHNGTIQNGWNSFALSSGFTVLEGQSLLVLVERNYGGSGAGGHITGARVNWGPPSYSHHRVWGSNTTPPTSTGANPQYRPNLMISYTIPSLPGPAQNLNPSDNSQDVSVNPLLSWQPGSGTPSSYTIYLGSDNPPSNIINGYQQIGTNYQAENLLYDTQYYWSVVPQNSLGSALNCPVTSFRTTDVFSSALQGVDTGNGIINPTISIDGVSGAFNPVITTSWAPTQITSIYSNAGLVLNLSGDDFSGKTLNITHSLGFIPEHLAYRIQPETSFSLYSNPGNWTESTASFIVPLNRAEGDIDLVFPAEEGQTLPVQLSSFSALITSYNQVRLEWITQSEAGLIGFYIVRNGINDVANALMVTPMITATNTSTEASYSYTDLEVDQGMYYYWLQSIDMSGQTQIFGPCMAELGTDDQVQPPEIPLSTRIKSVFPNPFNPNVTIRYELAKEDAVNINIYNIRGQKIWHTIRQHSKAGEFSINWNGRDDKGVEQPSGVYIYRFETSNQSINGRFTLSK